MPFEVPRGPELADRRLASVLQVIYLVLQRGVRRDGPTATAGFDPPCVRTPSVSAGSSPGSCRRSRRRTGSSRSSSFKRHERGRGPVRRESPSFFSIRTGRSGTASSSGAGSRRSRARSGSGGRRGPTRSRRRSRRAHARARVAEATDLEPDRYSERLWSPRARRPVSGRRAESRGGDRDGGGAGGRAPRRSTRSDPIRRSRVPPCASRACAASLGSRSSGGGARPSVSCGGRRALTPERAAEQQILLRKAATCDERGRAGGT